MRPWRTTREGRGRRRLTLVVGKTSKLAKLFGTIGGFLTWWWRELNGLVPRRLRRILRGERGEAIFCFDGDVMRLSRRVDGRERALGEIDLTRTDPRSA